ncbi:hypothetical protein GQ53DRAFT_774186 [Thozetella sp. PMI_491]|nr:hypothetical protein GQ53DRAFT_774186 [Thozetella sp. PMI_491]
MAQLYYTIRSVEAAGQYGQYCYRASRARIDQYDQYRHGRSRVSMDQLGQYRYRDQYGKGHQRDPREESPVRQPKALGFYDYHLPPSDSSNLLPYPLYRLTTSVLRLMLNISPQAIRTNHPLRMLLITLLGALPPFTLALPGNGAQLQNPNGLVTIIVDGFPSVTPAPTHCDNAWCTDGTTWCEYWAGATSWDLGRPVPGETPVPLGACTVGDVITVTTTVLVTTTA